MTNKQAADVIRVERLCVQRASGGNCDRECGECDLVMPEHRIYEAYDLAIKALEGNA